MATRAFREMARSVPPTYSVIFLFVAMLAFALACFGFAFPSTGALRWLFAGLGVAFAAGALFIALYAILCKPELLWSEEYGLLKQLLDCGYGDNAVDQASPGKSVSIQQVARKRRDEPETEPEEDNG